MQRLSRWGLALSVAMAACAAAAQPLTRGEEARVDQIVSTALKKSGAPSASIAIVRDGQVALVKAYGRRSIAPELPATTHARYKIGSVSKQITATALLTLIQNGRLSLDDKIGKWMPDLTGAQEISVREVLSQTSGYTGYFSSEVLPAAGRRPVAPLVIAETWGRKPLEFTPGAAFDYSNTNYVIAGLLVERISGEPLADYVQQRLFRPLHIADAVNVVSTPSLQDAQGYTRFVLGPLRPPTIPGPGWEFGAGGWAMTAEDLAKWDLGVITRKVLSPSLYMAQQTPPHLKDGRPGPYGLGFFIDTVAGHRRLHHPGDDAGFLAENRIYPDDRAAVAVLINADFGDAQDDIADGVERLLLDQPEPPARASHGPPQELADTTRPEEIDLARRLYSELRQGTIDRDALNSDANDYFSPSVLADYHASLSQLGDPVTFQRLRSMDIAGEHATLFQLSWPGQILALVIRTMPSGKISALTIFQPE